MLLLLYKFSDNSKEVVYKKKKTGHPLNMSRKNMIKGILFLVIACMIFVAGQRKSNNIIQQNLKSNLIRFHVRANSNSRMDQTYKLKVRDAVIDQISPELSEAKTKEEAFKILKMQKNRIKNTAQEILKKEGVKQKVNVHFVQEKFPEKNYGQYTFPEGIYDAVRIDLGAAKGHNWWCVMYPNMCFSDTMYEVIDEDARSSLKRVLSEDEYQQVLASGDYQVKFKSFEILKGLYDEK